MQTRVLWVSEASVLKTGYAIYSKEILSRLFQQQNLYVAEFAAYISQDDARIHNIPWKVYPNLPNNNDEEGKRLYLSDTSNQFGAWRFENVVLDFLPHVVIGISDFWMQSYICWSPYRQYYKHFWMPTVDAEHQDVEWLTTYNEVDTLFTYQDWSLDLLKKESNNNIRPACSAPPCADEAFKPNENKDNLKKAFGLEGFTIFGTVMRNQRRKLYPALFRTFRKFLDQTNNKNTLLYCHTSYPDRGWNIPELLMEYGLSNKVLFTYVCKNCEHSFPSFFSDAITFCTKCSQPAASCANVHYGVDNKTLAVIYNLFDVYIQYHASEGFGIPLIEAAACGIPVVGVNYSALEDTLKKLGGYPLKVYNKEVELETGRLMAVPDDNDLLNHLILFTNMSNDERRKIGKQIRENYLIYYNWDNTASIWLSEICKIDPDIEDKKWYLKPNIKSIPNQMPTNISNEQYARFLILYVLQEPKFANTYFEAKLIRDLNYGCSTHHLGSMYFNEMSQLFTGQNHQVSFSRKDAFEFMLKIRNKINYWENLRAQKLGLSYE